MYHKLGDKFYFNFAKTIFLIFLLQILPETIFAQTDCAISIGEHNSCSSKLFNKVNAANLTVTISPIGDNTFKISDISAGFFSDFNVDYKLPTEIKFNCDTLIPSSFATDYGTCEIVSGDWDAEQHQFKIHWKIPYNGVDEVTLLTLQ